MRLGTLFGTPLFIHPLLILVLGLAAFLGHGRMVLIVAGSLATHELAHLIVARLFHIPVEKVTLFPFGGVAAVPGLGALDPAAAVLMALAGPFNNLLLLLAGFWAAAWLPLDAGLLHLYAQVNSLLVVVNLLPALPLDGGRVLQAVLRLGQGGGAALRRLIYWGYAAAGLLLLAGALSWWLGVFQLNLFILAAAVAWAAHGELATGHHAFLRPLWQRRAELQRLEVLPVRTLAAPAHMPLGQLLGQLGARHFHIIIVVNPDLQPVGRLDEGQLLAAALAGRWRTTLAQLLQSK